MTAPIRLLRDNAARAHVANRRKHRFWYLCGVVLTATLVSACLVNYFSSTDQSSHSDSPQTATAAAPVVPTAKPIALKQQAPWVIALDAFDREFDPDRREQLLTQIIGDTPTNDFSRVLEFLASARKPNTMELRQRLIRRWAEIAPAQASAWAVSLQEDEGRGEALTQVAIAWANIDARAAADWTESLPQGETATREAVVAFAYEAARLDPLAALEAAVRLDASPERDDALVHCISQWAASDPNQAYAWANQVPDSELRQRLIATVLTAAAEQDGSSAALLATTQIDPSEAQNRLALSIVQRWAQTSPETAAAWVAQFPEGALRSTATENLAAIWSLNDPAGARTWIEGLPESLRDDALKAASPVLMQQ